MLGNMSKMGQHEFVCKIKGRKEDIEGLTSVLLLKGSQGQILLLPNFTLSGLKTIVWSYTHLRSISRNFRSTS
jgi:hypothetical protein